MEYDFSAMPCYGMKTKWAAAAISGYYDQFMKPCGITGRQFNFLCLLNRNGGCSARELADITRVDKSTLARNLKLLMSKDLVVDLKAPNERNSKLSLTPTGKNTLAAALIQWKAAQESLKQRFGEQELALVDKVLAEIGSLSMVKN